MNCAAERKAELDTPCLVLDLDVVERNLQKMQAAAAGAGKNLRPHVKTHKCSALARKQIEAGASGVCVAKVSEAEALVKAGLDDILITGPLVTARKIEKLADLLAAAPGLMVVVDSPAGIEILDASLRARGLSMGVLIDLDVGLHRTGVGPADAMKLADRIAAASSLRLRGVQAYAGQVQHVSSYHERKQASIRCMQEAVQVFRELRAAVPTCTILSASGTGTFDIDLAVPEITELQAGSYVCMDAEYLAIGSAEDDARFVSFDPALRLLTTVVSANHEGMVTVDAGLKALYRDGAKPRVIVSENQAALDYDWFGDEYGKITRADGAELPPLGRVLELVTSHCDPTVNLFEIYYLTRGDEVVGTWPIDLRGCSQ